MTFIKNISLGCFSLIMPLLLIFSAPPASAQPPAEHVDYVAGIEQYASEPFLKFKPSIPQVMLVLERDWKIFYPAYNNIADLNGDQTIDNGFNPAITYIGYYDVDSCYVNDGDKFYRIGATTPQTHENVMALRPSQLNHNISSPPSAHGVCPGTSSTGTGTSAKWSGNWLNYALTSRMDAIRKVLYGGKRVTDTQTKSGVKGVTILEPSYTPSNAFAWGNEIVSDQLWNSHAPDSPWYPSELYTGLTRPTGKFMHFFAKVDHASYGQHVAKSAKPLMRILLNVDSNFLHPISQTPVRYWDWVYGQNIIPNDLNMPSSATKISMGIRVQVCKADSISPTEGCWLYGNDYKPIGLLQQHGERGNMQFGLMTATASNTVCTSGASSVYDGRCNDKGGVLRHHIQRLSGTAINSTTGAIIPDGLIGTIDKLELADYVDAPQQYHFSTFANSGNPVGEMVLETLRYLSGATAGLPAYNTATTELLGLKKANWGQRPPEPAEDCTKPIILVISDIFPTYDGNDIPTAAQLSAPKLKELSQVAMPSAWSMRDYLEKITNLEGYRTSGRQYYYPKTSESQNVRGLCVAKDFTAGLSLADIRG
ncbi:MAG: hypothetical protein LBJ64_11890, partial [Deltaproteobacteria bacterium]|nr:hypothetical protein [Deltaproteobacteria bacterium]